MTIINLKTLRSSLHSGPRCFFKTSLKLMNFILSRDAALNELWHELERLVLSMSSLSPQHGKVKDCLYMIRKPTINEESLLALSGRFHNFRPYFGQVQRFRLSKYRICLSSCDF